MKKKSSCCSTKDEKDKDSEESKFSDKNEEEKIEDINRKLESVIEKTEKAVESSILAYKLAFWRKISGALSFLLIVSLAVQFSGATMLSAVGDRVSNTNIIPSAYASEVLPEEGVELPITWGDLGMRMIEAGVIDAEKFEALYERRGGMSNETKLLLQSDKTKRVVLTSENSGELLNLLWAFGLSNKSPILEEGPITKYDGKIPATREEMLSKAGRMAATGGWPLSVGNPMDHYSAHEFVTLTDEEWELVEKVASGIYRPCCNNPSHFPDCNHGMAMLGLIELLADEGLSESEMFDIALSINSFWFPDTYLAIAEYMDMKGISWNKVDSKEALGLEYSSGSGFASVQKALQSTEAGSTNTGGGGGGCGA